MTAAPRVVLAMPAFNRPDTLAEALESILSQTFADFSLIVLDDGSTAETTAIVHRYATSDARVIYQPNPTRLGMVRNWRACFEQARMRFPASVYFAWVSDHDAWHPRWLERLVAELDRHPQVVLAYPRTLRHGPEGFKVFYPFETFGVADPLERLRRASLEMLAGNLIYGLFRADALERAGVFRPVLLPDRQVLTQLALLGEFRQAPEILWYREIAREFSLRRQRAALFAARAPLYTYLPVPLQHAGALVWSLVVRGSARPTIGRFAGLRCAAAHAVYAVTRDLQRNDRRTAGDEGPRVTRWLQPILARIPVPAARDVERLAGPTERQ